MTPGNYFGKMNSTLGSVVPLAMFYSSSPTSHKYVNHLTRAYTFVEKDSTVTNN